MREGEPLRTGMIWFRAGWLSLLLFPAHPFSCDRLISAAVPDQGKQGERRGKNALFPWQPRGRSTWLSDGCV